MNDQTQDIRAIRTTDGLTAAIAPMTVCGPVDVLLPPLPNGEGDAGASWRASAQPSAGTFDRAA